MASVRKRVWKTASGEEKTAWFVDYVDQHGVRGRKQFATKRFADAFRVDIESKIQNGIFRPDANKVLFGEVADDFLEHCKVRRDRKERMTEKMYRVYDGHIKNYICPDAKRHENKKRPSRLISFDPNQGLAAIKVGQLTQGGVSAFRDRLRTAGLSVITTRKVISTVQCILKFAVGKDIVAVNVAENVQVIGRRDEGAKKIVPPTKKAMKALLDNSSKDFRVRLLVASATAVRAGEFHALRWKHFDLDKGEVRIETRVDAFGNEDTTKTAAGLRTIPIGHVVVTALKEWKLRSAFTKEDDLVFPNSAGTYESHDNMVKREFEPLFSKLSERHSENPEQHPAFARFSWHALRHFGISTWIEAGLLPKTIQTFAGHSSLQVTMDRYGHLFKSESHRKVMDEIAKQLFS